MTRRASLLAAILAASALWLTSPPSRGDQAEKRRRRAIQDDTLQLAKLLKANKGNEAREKAAAIHKKTGELVDLMWTFKPPAKGGLGVELKLIALGKRAPAKGQLN